MRGVGDGGTGWGRAIRRAVELGINWVHTAAVYGPGRSGEFVAGAPKNVSDAGCPYVFTKCSLVWDESGDLAIMNKQHRRGRVPAFWAGRRGVRGSYLGLLSTFQLDAEVAKVYFSLIAGRKEREWLCCSGNLPSIARGWIT
jgi:hypothetical protein